METAFKYFSIFLSLCFYIQNIFLSLLFLLKIFFSLCFFIKFFFASSNIWICVLRFMGELCRADLWHFFFERPHFHNRSEFNRPWDSASICYYFGRFWEVIIVILDFDLDFDFEWLISILDINSGSVRAKSGSYPDQKFIKVWLSNYKEGKFQNFDNLHSPHSH